MHIPGARQAMNSLNPSVPLPRKTHRPGVVDPSSPSPDVKTENLQSCLCLSVVSVCWVLVSKCVLQVAHKQTKPTSSKGEVWTAHELRFGATTFSKMAWGPPWAGWLRTHVCSPNCRGLHTSKNVCVFDKDVIADVAYALVNCHKNWKCRGNCFKRLPLVPHDVPFSSQRSGRSPLGYIYIYIYIY